MSKKEKTTSKEKSKQKHSNGASSSPGRDKLVFIIIIVTIIVGILGFLYTQSLDDIRATDEYIAERSSSEDQNTPSPPEDEPEFTPGIYQLEQYIEQAEEDTSSDTSEVDRVSAYLNAALLAAKLSDDRAPSLASEALGLIASSEFTIEQDVEVLLQGITEGNYSEEVLNEYAPTIEGLEE
jgi:cytoskeletal protein RodZ